MHSSLKVLLRQEDLSKNCQDEIVVTCSVFARVPVWPALQQRMRAQELHNSTELRCIAPLSHLTTTNTTHVITFDSRDIASAMHAECFSDSVGANYRGKVSMSSSGYLQVFMGGVAGCMHASVSCLGASGVLLLFPMGRMLHHARCTRPCPSREHVLWISGVRLSCVPRHAS